MIGTVSGSTGPCANSALGAGVLGWAGGWLGAGLAGRYAGVAEEGGDGVGESSPDGGLVLFGPVEDLDVQRVDQGLDQVGGGVIKLAGEVGQFV